MDSAGLTQYVKFECFVSIMQKFLLTALIEYLLMLTICENVFTHFCLSLQASALINVLQIDAASVFSRWLNKDPFLGIGVYNRLTSPQKKNQEGHCAPNFGSYLAQMLYFFVWPTTKYL